MSDTANHQHMPTRELREHLGRRVDAAYYAGETTIVTKNGEPRAVLMSLAKYQDAMEKLAALVPVTLAESSDPTSDATPTTNHEEN